MCRLLIVSSLILLPGCISFTDKPDTGIKHIVLCWLAAPGNSTYRDQVIRTSKELATIPGIIDMSVGTAVPSDRKIIDDSFDVGIVMTFNNIEEMNAYINHEEHMKRVREVLGPSCQRILVYDFAY